MLRPYKAFRGEKNLNKKGKELGKHSKLKRHNTYSVAISGGNIHLGWWLF